MADAFASEIRKSIASFQSKHPDSSLIFARLVCSEIFYLFFNAHRAFSSITGSRLHGTTINLKKSDVDIRGVCDCVMQSMSKPTGKLLVHCVTFTKPKLYSMATCSFRNRYLLTRKEICCWCVRKRNTAIWETWSTLYWFQRMYVHAVMYLSHCAFKYH